MPYLDVKVYFDGSHYIGIPKTQKPSKVTLWEYQPEYGASVRGVWIDSSDEQDYPSITPEQDVTDFEPCIFWYDDGKREIQLIDENTELPKEVKFESIRGKQQSIFDEPTEQDIERPNETYDDEMLDVAEPTKKEKKLTLRDVFNELYKDAVNLPKKERNEYYRDNLLPFFSDEESMNGFVQSNLDRKKRNMTVRFIRMTRKANLADFNYFCTFTYADGLHDETSFKKQLKTCFRHLRERKGWKYMGVWERGEQERLHFHGLFNIPEGQMVGEVTEAKDYSVKLGRVQVTHPNSYFNKKFGRSDFDVIDEPSKLGDALRYIMKYIGKTGEKIVYSKGLPQYFITDVAEDDVATRMGVDDRKLVLFDNFACYNNRQYVGTVSKETIDKMPKANK